MTSNWFRQQSHKIVCNTLKGHVHFFQARPFHSSNPVAVCHLYVLIQGIPYPDLLLRTLKAVASTVLPVLQLKEAREQIAALECQHVLQRQEMEAVQQQLTQEASVQAGGPLHQDQSLAVQLEALQQQLEQTRADHAYMQTTLTSERDAACVNSETLQQQLEQAHAQSEGQMSALWNNVQLLTHEVAQVESLQAMGEELRVVAAESAHASEAAVQARAACSIRAAEEEAGRFKAAATEAARVQVQLSVEMESLQALVGELRLAASEAEQEKAAEVDKVRALQGELCTLVARHAEQHAAAEEADGSRAASEAGRAQALQAVCNELECKVSEQEAELELKDGALQVLVRVCALQSEHVHV